MLQPAETHTVGETLYIPTIHQKSGRSGYWHQQGRVLPPGRSSSFIHIFFQDSTNDRWIGGNHAKGRLCYTRLPLPFTPSVFGWWHEDFHLGSIRHRESFIEDTHISLHISFISHSPVSPDRWATVL